MKDLLVLLLLASPGLVQAGALPDRVFANRFELAVAPILGDLVITEVMADPVAVPDAVGEWFEILVVSDRAIDLDGCTLSNSLATTALAGYTPVDALSHVVFARQLDPTSNGGVPADLAFSFALLNAGQLSIACGGELLDTVSWPGSTIGRSRSLTPAANNPVANDNPANWCLSTLSYNGIDTGSPTFANEVCP